MTVTNCVTVTATQVPLPDAKGLEEVDPENVVDVAELVEELEDDAELVARVCAGATETTS